MQPTPTWYLLLPAAIFAIGVFGVLVRRNPLVMFMCIELMLNAANLSFVAFANCSATSAGSRSSSSSSSWRRQRSLSASAIIVAIFRRKPGATADDIALMKG